MEIQIDATFFVPNFPEQLNVLQKQQVPTSCLCTDHLCRMAEAVMAVVTMPWFGTRGALCQPMLSDGGGTENTVGNMLCMDGRDECHSVTH